MIPEQVRADVTGAFSLELDLGGWLLCADDVADARFHFCASFIIRGGDIFETTLSRGAAFSMALDAVTDRDFVEFVIADGRDE